MSVIIRNKKDGLPMGVFMRYTVGRRVLAKVVDSKLLCATRVITNTQEGMDTWREYPSIESAAAQLGVAPPKYYGCPIIDKKHPPIKWGEFKGLYFLS